MSASTITISLGLFLLAGLFEIAGGWLVWQWIRDAKPLPGGLLGGSVLFLYGVIPTFQPAHFGRVYAAYGGFFIVLSLLWGLDLGWEQTRFIGFDRRRREFGWSCYYYVLA